MKTYKSLFITGALALVSAGFTSCSDDEEYDFPGTTNNYVYQLDRSSSFKVIQTPTVALSNISLEIPVQCSNKAQGDIKVTFGIDNTLIEAYNEEHETNYVAIPDGIILFERDVVTIPAGKFKAEETIKVIGTDDETALKAISNENEYLVPIVRKQVEGVNAFPSQDANPVNYMIVSVIKDNIHHGAAESDIKGTLVEDQSGWIFNLIEGKYSGKDPQTVLFDGEMTTYTSLRANTGEDLTFTIDMGKSYTFDAMTLLYGSKSMWGTYTYGQFTTTMNVSTSQDGQNWQKVGIMENGDSNVFMIFYGPVTARYVKIHEPNQLNGYSPRMTVGKFNVYAL